MVKVTIAGGSGQVAKEIIDALLASGKHEITVLSRNNAPFTNLPSAIHWRVVNYNDKHDLTEALRGTHTLFSFIQLLTDPEQQSQRNLIDAAIAVGVKRFAPSEYGSAGTDNMPWWAGKDIVRDYLRHVNKNHKVLEYTLFQPGLFLDYLASPYKTAKHVEPLDTVFDFHHVDYEGEWPETGGIRGNRVAVRDIIKIGQTIRGRPFTVDKVTREDLEAGPLKTSWGLEKRHPAVTDEQASEMIRTVSIGILLSSVKGAWDVSDDFNRLLPDHRFDEIHEFLAGVWKGKP